MKFLPDRPYKDKKFDLILVDGAVLESHGRSEYRTKHKEAARQGVSELVFALQQIKIGGIFIMLLHQIKSQQNTTLLREFEEFATVNVKKSNSSHQAIKGTWVAKKIDTPEAKNAKLQTNQDVKPASTDKAEKIRSMDTWRKPDLRDDSTADRNLLRTRAGDARNKEQIVGSGQRFGIQCLHEIQ